MISCDAPLIFACTFSLITTRRPAVITALSFWVNPILDIDTLPLISPSFVAFLTQGYILKLFTMAVKRFCKINKLNYYEISVDRNNLMCYLYYKNETSPDAGRGSNPYLRQV